MRALIVALAALLSLGAVSSEQYEIDQARYFSSPSAEAASRTTLTAEAGAFIASATPERADAMRRWLEAYDALLERLERHDIYVYLRAEENDSDTADAKADDELGQLEDRLGDRIVRAAQQLGSSRVETMSRAASLAPYRYLLEDSLANAAHRLSSAQQGAVDLTATPVLDAAAATYKRLRKSSDSIASHQEAYAALLVSIAAARNGVARLRGFDGAAEASYFDKAIPRGSVERTLTAVRASTAYARYRAVAALAPKPGFSPAPLAIADAIPVILAAEQPMGDEYASTYAALLDAKTRRLEICTASECDDTGFSLGFAGLESAVYFGGYTGSVRSVRAVAHESGHAVHRQFMSRNQPIAAYNLGPSFMFESFAIFNELLFLDHLYRTAPNDQQRAYYLNYFLEDATFQVFGSAQETDLEGAIYRGVDGGSVRTADDLNALAVKVFAHYDPSSAQDPTTALYWARDRLFYTDPLYDVNYLYAGLLALQYFTDFERDPAAFSRRYVALLKNGFTDAPAALEKHFLGIDLTDETGLVAGAAALIDGRTAALSKLYGNAPSTKAGYASWMQVTWKPVADPAHAVRAKLPESAFAFPSERKEPLTDAGHVRSAVARFGEVQGVTDTERAQAFANIKAAAEYYGVTVSASSWRDLVG
ncbi:MAG: M3 family metallopeptidase [Candidatus Cybelea sp.]